MPSIFGAIYFDQILATKQEVANLNEKYGLELKKVFKYRHVRF